MRSASWVGTCRSTRRSCGPTSTLPEHGTATRATQGARANYKNLAVEPPDHAIGRSRGGRTTKIHLACDASGKPLSLWLTGGNTNDTTELEAVLDRIRVPRPIGRPRTTPDRLIADKGYSSRVNRQLLAGRGIKVTIPERDDQKGHRLRRGPSGGRPYAFDAEIYRGRNVVERCFSWLKHWRAIATRYDKKATNYLGALTVASLLLWARR